MFRFEKLLVWQKAIAFADLVYGVTESFPNDEKFGLISQLRRAAVSVSANIAEGSGRGSNVENKRFVEIAYGSLMEVVSLSYIGRNRRFLADEGFQQIWRDAEEISRMLSGLRRSLSKDNPN